MSKTFCALPFVHLTFAAGGRAQICCKASELITEHGSPMSLSVHTIDEIWNSAYMRTVRRAMLKGERLSVCQTCYDSEAACGHSHRTLAGNHPTQTEVRKWLTPDYRIKKHPSFLKLELENLCNLKCRMCCGANSSEIERDPVHTNWTALAGPQAASWPGLHAVWRADIARIGPEPHIGVSRSGLYPQELVDGVVRCWTDGHAIFNVPVQSGARLSKLEISFHRAGVRGQQFEVIVNGRPAAKGILQNADAPVVVDLSEFGHLAELTIEIVSNKVVEVAGQPERGVPLSDLILRCETAASGMLHPQRLSSRHAAEGPWYMDDRIIFGEVLKPELERLNITGGETFISKRFVEVLDFLARSGWKHILLELPTNCTHVDNKLIERLSSFERVELTLSLDGIGKTFEYIRYPARWSVVDANVRKLVQSGLSCLVAPVVQIYNITRLPELYDYCDALGLRVLENMLSWPSRLAVSILPPKTRKAIAADLFRYCQIKCPHESKRSRQSVAEYLDNLTSDPDPGLIKEFMIFTNDLDATRGQDFRRMYPELVELLAQDGFAWIDDTLYARGNYTRTPARERDYAWL